MKRLLEDVRIVDMSRMLSGPYCSMILGDMGAEIIKVEDPKGGDPMRLMTPQLTGGLSAYFVSINRNKKSFALDLKKPGSREVFERLVKNADVVLDNFRPGVLEKLGADFETLKTYNPHIISCSITGFGDDGPYRDFPAFDIIFQAYAGAMSITGEPGGTPSRLGLPMGDLTGATMAIGSISAALLQRERTGEGRRVSVSLIDGLVSNLCYMAQYYWTDGKVPGRLGSGHQSVVPYQAFKTADIYIVVAIFVDRFWNGFCEALGLSELADDPRFETNAKRSDNRAELIPILEKRFLEKTGEEWLALLKGVNVPCAPINPLDKVLSDPQVLHNKMVVDVEVPGAGTVKTLGNALKCEGVEDAFTAPQTLGESTDVICRELLGYTDDEIHALHEGGVV